MTIDELCDRHARIGLDANVLIYVLDRREPQATVGRALLDAIEDGRTSAVMSVLALAEIAAGPARVASPADVERLVAEARSVDGVRWLPLTGEVAVDAGVIRGARGIGLADAIHLATARAAGATAFVTNDQRLRGTARLEVVSLAVLEP